MFAQVVLLQRLPSEFDFFDYVIPSHLKVNENDLVFVPFRRKKTIGVVVKIQHHSTFKGTHKEIIDVHHALLTPSQRALSEWMIQMYGAGRGVVYSMCVPPLGPRAFALLPEFQTFLHAEQGKKKISVVRYFLWKQCVEFCVKASQKGSLLILVPTRSMIVSLKKDFPSAHFFQSDSKDTEKRAVWNAVRQNNTKITIGTRAALFLPFVHLMTVVVIDEEHEGYKQWDSSPRYRIHEPLEKLQRLSCFDIVYMSRVPSVATVGSVPPEQRHTVPEIPETCPPRIPVTLVDMRHERAAKNFSSFSYLLSEKINETLSNKKSVFLLVQSKGMSSVHACAECGEVSRCGECHIPLFLNYEGMLTCRYCTYTLKCPPSCVRCGSVTIAPSHKGVEGVVKEAQKFFHAPVIGFDAKTKPDALNIQPPFICIGTHAAIPYLNFHHINLVGIIDADRHLRIPELYAEELFLSHAVSLHASFQKCHGEGYFLLQTFDILHTALRALSSGVFAPWYTEALKMRQSLMLPPQVKLVKVTIESIDAAERAKKIVETCGRNLKIPPIIFPLYPEMRGANRRFGILFKLSPAQWENEWAPIVKCIDHAYKIDINPISLLS